MWVRVKDNDTYAVFVADPGDLDGDGQLFESIGSGATPSSSGGDFETVELSFDPLSSALEVSINGQAISLDGGSTSYTLLFTPDVQFAGMHINQGVRFQTRIDDFLVSIDPAVHRDTFTWFTGQPRDLIDRAVELEPTSRLYRSNLQQLRRQRADARLQGK